MRALRSFEEYLKQGVVRRAQPDTERAKSLLAESERKLTSLKERLDKIGVKDSNANDYVEYCYDLLMLLVRARLYIDGYATAGLGAHEAEVSYLRVLGFSEGEVRQADQMRYFRNGILYYGQSLDVEYTNKVIGFTLKQYPKLKRLASTR